MKNKGYPDSFLKAAIRRLNADSLNFLKRFFITKTRKLENTKI